MLSIREYVHQLDWNNICIIHDNARIIELDGSVSEKAFIPLADCYKEEELFEIATNAGAKDLKQVNNIHEIITEKEDFYKIKSELEQKIEKLLYSQIEWRALNYVKLDNEQSKKMIEIFSILEELDDVQNVYSNATIIN